MIESISFEVLGKPCAKSRPRFRRMGNYVQTYSTEENINYENLIKVMFINGGFTKIPSKTPIKCVIECFYQIPKSFSKVKIKKALNGDMVPLVKPDIDNVAKIVLDSLNGIAFDDDSAITELIITKKYSDVAKIIIHLIKNN